MSSLTKRAFNNIFWMFISELCGKGAAFFTTIYLARVLGVAGFGKYSLALAAGVYIWTIVDMGVAGYGVREVARDRENASEILSVLNSMRLVIAVVVLLLFMAVLSLLNIPSEIKLVLIIGGVFVVATALSPDWVTQGMERMEYLAFSNSIIAVIFITTIFMFVKSSGNTVAAVFYRFASFFIGSIVAMIVLKKKLNIGFSFQISPGKWWFHVKESFYFAVNGAINNIALYIPIFFLGVWASMEAVGLFSAPQKIIISIVSASMVITSASYPMQSSLFITDREKFFQLHKSFERLLVYMGIPIGVMGMLLGSKIITALYGSSYSSSSAIFSIMIWFVPLILVRANYGRTLASAGLYRFNMIATGSGAIVSTILYLIFIPRFGGVGASFSMLSGELVVLLVMGTIFRMKLRRVTFFDLYFLKVAFAGIVSGVVVKGLDLPLVYSMAMGAALYFGISFAIGLITIEKMRDVYRKVVQRKLEAV